MVSLKKVFFLAFGIASSSLFAQNVGIGIAGPLEKLHVAGNVRVNPLAGAGTRIVGADLNGTLVTVAAGANGQVLTQTAGGPLFQNASNDWTILGNAGINPATNFLGTTDAQPLIIRTTNVERARVLANGQVVVNTPTPFAGDVFSSYAGAGNYAVNGYAVGTGVAAYFQAQGTGGAMIAAQTGTLGSAGQFTISGAAANTSPALDVYNATGNNTAIAVRTDLANATASGMTFDINGAAAKRGIEMDMDAAVTGIGIAVFHNGTNRALNLQSQNAAYTGVTLFANHTGNGRIINAQNTALTTNTTQTGFFSQGSTGLVTGTYGNAAALWGQSSGIRGGVFLAAGGSANNNCLQGSYSGAAGNFDGIGVLGVFAPAVNYGYGVVGQGNWYGVFANGDMGASGVKPFVIDHPLDPENQYLRHFAIESPEVLNVYRGTVVLDVNGQAIVQLPSYFHAINVDFSYNLTAIGAAANLFIAEEIDANGNFRIAGGQSGQKVCWNVYADRNDPYVQQNPSKVTVELAKRPEDVGLYMRPELYGQPQSKGVLERYKADPSKVTVVEETELNTPPAPATPIAQKPVQINLNK